VPGTPVGDHAARLAIAAVGGCVALVAAAVLVAWASGDRAAAAWAEGWRVMVPGTAFVFVCVGFGLVAHAIAAPPAMRVLVPALALAAAWLPVCTLTEYASGARFGFESALGIPFPPGDPIAGRMSPVAALSLTLLAAGLAALTSGARLAETVVRLAGGTTLTVSWLAVLAVSFESRRLGNVPTFPNMAVPTIVLLGVSSVAMLAASPGTMARIHGAHLNAAIAPGTLVAAFAVPLLLGWTRQQLVGVMDPGLAGGFVVLAFAASLGGVVWRTLARLQAFQEQRDRLFTELERRVDDRTRALAVANQQLHQRERQLREADRRKDEFLATLAHELRNPLAPIRTGLAIVRESAAPPATIAQAHQLIGRQIRTLVRLIDDLLDVSRITAGKLELRLERIDVRDVVRHGVEATRPEVDAAGHTLTVRLPDEPLPMLGDPTRLTQIVANLVQNATKYTPAGGHIDVAASRQTDTIAISVRDDGIGIAAEHLPKLFETFSQVVPGLGRGGGLGLGLAIVRGLVSLHGGRVDAKSAGRGRGSEFVVQLQASAPAAAERAPAAVEEAAPAAVSRRVLVVDDNVDNTEALSLYLRQRGHAVTAAYDGDEACRLAESFRPDVVLLDIGLPGRSGHDVCRFLRAQPWGTPLLIVAQTGWGQRADRERSRRAGFDLHLVKPIDPVELATLVEAARPPEDTAARAASA
jgi:signal transduction histidine kinase/ActR/RegA family two-component response regulator